MSVTLKSLSARLYAFAFFDAFILIYPLYTLLFADKGLSPARISSLLIVWSATTFLLELPSGALADKLSRKRVMLIGIATKILGFTIWLTVPNYWGFLLGFVCWGVKSAFILGAQDALVFEELRRIGHEEGYAKITGRMKALNSLGLVLSGLGASLLARHGYSPILVLSIASMVVSAIALWSVPETHEKIEAEGEITTYLQYVKLGARLIFRQPHILYLVLFMTVIFSLGVVDEYFSLFFRSKGLSNTAVAFWVGAVYFAGGLGNLIAHRFDGRKLPTVPSLLFWGVLFGLASMIKTPFAPLLVCLYMFYFSALAVLGNAYLQRELADKTRATAVSVMGVFIETFSLLTYFSLGVVTHGGNYGDSLRFIGVVAAVCGVALFLRFKQPWLTTKR